MPRIPEYEAPNLSLPTVDRAVEARSQAGRRVAAMYEDAGGSIQQAGRTVAQIGSRTADVMRDLGRVAETQIAHQEISSGSAEFAKLQDGIQREWDATVKQADPNDPSVAQKFLEERVRPQLEQFANKGFLSERGQRWAESHSISLQQHMWQKTAADMSTMAGLAVKVNAEETVNRLSSTVRQDPSSLDFALRTAESSIGGVVETSPTLTPAAAAQARGALTLHAKERIVQSYLQGVAEKNPEEAVKIVESGKYADFIDGPTAKQIIGYARTNARLALSEERSERVMREHTAKQDFHQRLNELELSTIPEQVGDVPTLPPDYWDRVRKLGEHPGAALEPGRLAGAVRRGEVITSRLNKPEPLAQVSQRNTVDLMQQIRNGEITTNSPIYERFSDGGLKSSDFKFLLKEFDEARTPEGQRLSAAKRELNAAVKASITKSNPLMGKMDQDGDLQLYRFNDDMAAKIAQYRAAGKNVYDLFDPAKPDYLGSAGAIAPYQKPLQQSVRDQAARMRGGAATTTPPAAAPQPAPPPPAPTIIRRNPGESIEDYRKRLGAGFL